ncbi:hypothetical protein [Ochrobactrum sp. Marseille-Q0166]|uniref:hypothetical protein n=1 Tax=Ochrobactrum sp. Marseille-Q0166 TaxID=2761105 RepID=UPI00165544BF|nr:hypothetical protein [Ochrobactrum sp. Marseille-Q0166]MBC8716392.1 hypothetical protein [Ochrobactrum sp. Marseille-Q0166]
MDLLSRWSPRLFLIFGWVLPMSAISGNGLAFAIAAGGLSAIANIIASIMWMRFLVYPMQRARFSDVGCALARSLRGLSPDAKMVQGWSSPFPGALAVTVDSKLLLIDRTTNYLVYELQSNQILDVRIYADLTAKRNEGSRVARSLAVFSRPSIGRAGGASLELLYRAPRHHEGMMLASCSTASRTVIELGVNLGLANTLRESVMRLRTHAS